MEKEKGYYKIVKATINCKGNHNEIKELIRNLRYEQFYNAESDLSLRSKESTEVIQNLEYLMKWDNFLEAQLPQYNPHKFINALQN